MMTFLNDSLFKEIERRLRLHHELYTNPVNATYWEEILHRSLKTLGYDSHWDCGSHNSAYDILNENTMISCKSGKFSKTYLKFSGYRLTSHNTLNDKIDFIVSHNESLHMFLSSKKNNGHITYTMSSIMADKIGYDRMNWKEQPNKIFGENNGYKAEIVKKMSDQLWTSIPIDELNIHFSIIVRNFQKYVDT